jgi:hypothetical protein
MVVAVLSCDWFCWLSMPSLPTSWVSASPSSTLPSVVSVIGWPLMSISFCRLPLSPGVPSLENARSLVRKLSVICSRPVALDGL